MYNLENVREVPQVEYVVELNGGGQEHRGQLVVERQRRVDERLGVALHRQPELVQRVVHVLRQDLLVDPEARVQAGEAKVMKIKNNDVQFYTVTMALATATKYWKLKNKAHGSYSVISTRYG